MLQDSPEYVPQQPQQLDARDLLLGRFSLLLMSLVLLLAATSFLEADTGTAAQTFFCPILTGVLFIALVTVCRRHKNLALGLMLALPAVVLNWASAFSDSQLVTVFHNVFVMTFFAFVGFHVLYAALNDRRVKLDTIRGAVCVYFLTGIGWAYFYEILLSVDPNSFRFTPGAFVSAVATHGSSIIDITSRLHPTKNNSATSPCIRRETLILLNHGSESILASLAAAIVVVLVTLRVVSRLHPRSHQQQVPNVTTCDRAFASASSCHRDSTEC